MAGGNWWWSRRELNLIEWPTNESPKNDRVNDEVVGGRRRIRWNGWTEEKLSCDSNPSDRDYRIIK